MLNRLRALFPKPTEIPQSPFSMGKAVLDELAEVKRQIAELQQRPVQTSFSGDHEKISELEKEVSRINEWINSFDVDTKQIKIDVNNLDQKYISLLTSRIVSAHAKPRKKNGRFKAVRGHASA